MVMQHTAMQHTAPVYVQWVWDYCESRQKLTHFDYSVIVYQPLRESVKAKNNRYYYCENEKGITWKKCTSGHVKYLIAACLLELEDHLLSKAQENKLSVPQSWCKPGLCVTSDASLTKILSLCKERLQDDFIAISHRSPKSVSYGSVLTPITYHIRHVYE